MATEAQVVEPLEISQFPGQLPDEKVYLFERRYWFVLLQWLWAPMALTLALGLAAFGLTSLFEPLGYALPLAWRLLLWVLSLSPGCGWTIWRVLDWGNDRFIVTDCRVIHIDEIPLIRLRRDEAPLEMVQDVTVYMRGLWQNLLDFGDVISQTAGTLGAVRFTGIRRPREAQALIQALVEDRRRGTASRPGEDSLREIRELLGIPQPGEGTPPSEGKPLHGMHGRERREPLSLALRRLFLAEPQFGERQVVWRKHWWALLGALIQPALAFALATMVWLAVAVVVGRYSPWIDLFFGVALSGILIWGAWQILDWWNDLYVITEERVVDIEKIPLLAEERREARLDRIQDVRYDQPNLIFRLLDLGHVRLETAGEIGRFTFDYVPHPQEVQAEIFRCLAAFRRREEERRRQAQQEAFLELLGLYHQRTRG